MHRSLMAVAGLALVGTTLSVTPAVAADTEGDSPTVLARNQVGPLSLDVSPRGTVWYSQNFAGMLMRILPGGEPRMVARTAHHAELGAVSVNKGVVTFATTSNDGRTRLMERRRNGSIHRVANLSRYERRHNPDADAEYGIPDLDPSCEDEWPVKQAGPPSYTGIVESHPYASVTKGSARYVADAAGNAILKVRRDGSIATAAVLPPQPVEITAEGAEATGIPACAVGHTYSFEPVPTDVERAGDGMLYVTLLPGGPEDPSLGARASVLRVDPSDGSSEVVADGLLTATGLAVAGNGDIYVAELFGNRIRRIPAGMDHAVRWRTSTFPGDVEFADGHVYATRKVFAKGQVVRFPR
jgi:hypothetical protein